MKYFITDDVFALFDLWEHGDVQCVLIANPENEFFEDPEFPKAANLEAAFEMIRQGKGLEPQGNLQRFVENLLKKERMEREELDRLSE